MEFSEDLLVPICLFLFQVLKKGLYILLGCWFHSYYLPYFGVLKFSWKVCEGQNLAVDDRNRHCESGYNENHFESNIQFFDQGSAHPIKCSPVKCFASYNLGDPLHNIGTQDEICKCVSPLQLSSLTYCVVISAGNQIKELCIKTFASLPCHNKFLVKERIQDLSGITRTRLTLKCSKTDSSTNGLSYNQLNKDRLNLSDHSKMLQNGTGYVVFTCNKEFCADVKYPLPSDKAKDFKLGKGGNGFVFIMYHKRKQYAVKQTVYRPNEVRIHSKLKHQNVLPLLAVLMGEKHGTHSEQLYCYHFMPIMDYDLRRIFSAKEVGCLKHLHKNSLMNFDRAFSNVKYMLRELLKALAFIHSNGYVHRDVKASNIMIKMKCKCEPLYCDCTSKFQVKLGDFNSTSTIPGSTVTDQMIKFASILPLGTPGYRAPEVSMHIAMSGPYETLYTTAVDMWSFGCLCLNICIGKTAALKQREEASLILSVANRCFKELWERTTKINDVKPILGDSQLTTLIQLCLQVDVKQRPSALQAQKYLVA